MTKISRPAALVALGLLLAQTTSTLALAEQPPPGTLEPVRPVAPQFNDPGPQLTIPQPGNPLHQLSPLEGLGPPPDPLGLR
jgi:hypothetical protein